jgi:DNA-directed DNA polymerase III PolC
VIIHLDADAFFASVEQAADRRLRGRPIAVGGMRRGVVSSASYEARKWGIGAAMPVARAKKICPQLIVVPGDFEKYELFSRLIFAYAYDFTPLVEQGSIDEGYFDIGPNRKADPHQVAETVRLAIQQSLKLSVSEGVGRNKLVAQVASKLRKPDSLIEVPAGQERSFLAPLPNRWLPGVGPQLGTMLDAAGLREIGQIADISPEQLMLFAGGQAPQLRRFAQGEDDRLVVPERAEAKSFSKQETFSQDVTDETFIAATLRSMTDRLLAKLREQGKAIRTVSLKIRYNDMQDCLRSESLCEPTDLECDLYPVLDRLLKVCWQRRVSLRCVAVKLSQIYDSIPLELALDEESSKRQARSKAALVVDSLRAGGLSLMRGHDLWLRQHDGEPREDLRRPVSQATRAPSVIALRRGCACVEDFVPLNLRSFFSFMDSLLSPEAAVAAASGAGLRFAGLCDPNLHGAVPFAQAAKAAGIKALIGAELRIDGRKKLCFARNAQGYARLCELLTEEKENKRRIARPAVPARRGGENSRVSEQFADDLFLLDPGPALPAIRYLKPEDARRHAIVQSIRTLTRLHEPHPEKPLGAFHWPSADEIRAMPPEAVRRTREIAESCSFAFEFGKLHFPAYVPADGSPARVFLRRLVLEGFRRRYGSSRPEVLRQVEEELGIIAEVGYEEYFLVVWDLLQDCRQRGIDWITRGSAGDSLVCYCLGISDFCPIRFDLYFRRFLNRDRMALNKLPDIDLDFPHDRKDDVIDLLFEKFGTEHAAVVGGFNTFQSRSAVAEILKVLGVSEGQVRRFTERFPWTRLEELPALLVQSKECSELALDEEPYRTALPLAVFLDGFPRYPKMHPCGVVLSRVPIRSLSPTFLAPKGYPTTHFDMDAVEAVGLVKMDILAQAGLAVLRDMRKELGAGAGRADVPRDASAEWNDPLVWDMISSGQARGVHHIESPAMVSLSRMCNVHTIDQLVAVVSVIRPGAANSMKKVSFARRCQGLEPVEYPHPSLEPALRSTYGVVAYEEHILQICEDFAKLPPGRADLLRRALVKGKKNVIEEIRGEFRASALAAGRSEEDTTRVWALVAGFQGYAFCRAHSTAYALEAYESAWLKSRYPAEFLASVLTQGKGFYSTLVYTLEARRLGIGFVGPDINAENEGYACVAVQAGADGFSNKGDRRIRVPLSAIKGLSARTLEACRKGRPFASLDDFILRVPAEFSEILSLIRVGAFDSFGAKRAAQFWHASARAMEAGEGADLGICLADIPAEETLAEAPPNERLDAEWELLGFTIEQHPLARWPKIDWASYTPASRLGEYLDKDVSVCGLVVDERLHGQEDGRLMKFVLIADWSGFVECELFADAYERWGSVVARNPVLALNGRVEPFDNRKGWTLRVKSAAEPETNNQNSEIGSQKLE